MSSYKIKIPAQTSLSGDLTNFPLLITEKGIGPDFWLSATDTNIQVRASDNTTDLLTEVVWCDTTNERLRVHVTVPTISATVDTILYLNYDVTPTNLGSVFTDYEYVIPLQLLDSGDLANYGTGSGTLSIVGSPTFSNDGMAPLNGANYVNIAFPSAISQHYTSCRAMTTTTGQDGIYTYTDDTQRTSYTVDNGDSCGIWDSSNGWLYCSPTFDPLSTEYFVASGYVEAGVKRTIYADGASKNTDATYTALSDQTRVLIGSTTNSSEYLTGYVTEFRMMSTEPSDDWILFEALNMNGSSSAYEVIGTIDVSTVQVQVLGELLNTAQATNVSTVQVQVLGEVNWTWDTGRKRRIVMLI